MPAAVRLNLSVEGIAQLQRKLRADVLYAPPLREAMGATVRAAEAIVESRAPIGHTSHGGRLAASVTSRLDARPVPTWGRIVVKARSRSKKFPRGYAYPRLLEFAPKWGHKNWFLGSLVPAKSALAARLATAKARIEAIWRS